MFRKQSGISFGWSTLRKLRVTEHVLREIAAGHTSRVSRAMVRTLNSILNVMGRHETV